MTALTDYLDAAGVDYEVVEHRRTVTAAEDAQAVGARAADEAKTVLLRIGGSYGLAVVPASERLDLHKLRARVGQGEELRLASEDEMAAEFPEYELGALPPVGPTMPSLEVMDPRLLDCERVACTAGDHTHSLWMKPNDLTRLADPIVADICQD
ncbi:MAG TPA: YbaK/EbsC family protein [Thermoleophilaceae bacterium]